MEGRPAFVGTEDALTERIISVFYQVTNELGFGFLESVYCRAMAVALRQSGLLVEAEVPVPVAFRGETVGVFRADLIMEGSVILELKVADQITKTHEAQLLHYLRASTIEIGLIFSFGEKPLIKRMQFSNDRKASRLQL